jgi:hypothetical protein
MCLISIQRTLGKLAGEPAAPGPENAGLAIASSARTLLLDHVPPVSPRWQKN